jgi:hypothetical protein
MWARLARTPGAEVRASPGDPDFMVDDDTLLVAAEFRLV